MKRLLLLFLLALLATPKASEASHVSGAEITYEYIGDSTGIPYDYCVTLTLYRREQGISLPSSHTINIFSSCFGSTSVPVTEAQYSASNPNFTQGAPPRGDTNCIDQSDPGYASGKIEEYRYSGCLTLPGACADFTFSWDLCCRSGNITNLASFPALYIEAKLNNTLGPNSSPDFVNPAAKFFCVGQSFTWSQAATEPDQDSLHYALTQPLSAANSPINWAAGYNTTLPITSTGFNFNQATGLMTFSPVQAEVDVVKVRCTSYRFDSISSSWLSNGYVERDFQITIIQSCNSAVGQLKLNKPGFSDTATAELKCSEKLIEIECSNPVKCNSIAPDGSDFAIFNSQGNLVPIASAGTNNCRGTLTDQFWIELHDSIYYNDTLIMTSRLGNDLNTLENGCGYMLNAGDTTKFFVNDCSTSVRLDEKKFNTISLFPNPAQDILNVKFPGPSSQRKIEVLDLQGRVMLSQNAGDASFKLNIAEFPRGLYIIRFLQKDSTQNMKFEKL